EIRLLRLLPGQGPICCTLTHAALSNNLRYEALSYCWGDSSTKLSISCNGERLLVGESLYSALDHLRDSLQKPTLWIDAICINQTDIGERNSQVTLMRRIYSSCQRAVVWLGPADTQTELAF
ncbi:HET-domain-containing protein, partial [Lophium mytilinum]